MLKRMMTGVLTMLIAIAVTTPGLQAGKNDKAQPAELTTQGEKLQAQYTAELEQLKKQLTAAMPKVSDKAVKAYEQALADEAVAKENLAKAQKELGQIKGAHGLVGHAKNHWIAKADRGIKASQEAIKNAKTDAEREKAEKELANWKQNRQDGMDALKERQAKLDALLKDEPRMQKQLKDAEAKLAQAQDQVTQTMMAMNLKPFLTSDQFDGALAKYTLLQQSTPKRLAAFAQQSPRHKALVDELFKNDDMMVQMAVADGPAEGNLGNALLIYDNIQKASDKADEGTLQRLAMAMALEHAAPIKLRNADADKDAPAYADPVKRYQHYEAAFLNGELDPYFKDHSVWELRHAVNGEEPDEILAWGREMLRNYRPDQITTEDDKWRYVSSVRTDIRYGSQENKYDQDDLQFFQNILKNGGICGRRAFYGRFILRAFGNPTTARPQPGHAALARWTPDGWVVVLGAGWGAGWTKTQYDRDLDFLENTQARDAGEEAFMRVKRAQWVGNVAGEKPVYGTRGKNQPGFWYGVALNKQRQVIDEAGARTLAAVGEELGEANESKVKYAFESAEVSEADRKIRVDRNGVITIPAAATTKPTQSTGKVLFLDSSLGGKQLHYSRTGKDTDFEYNVNAPAAGTYNLTMRVVTPSWKQKLHLIVNGNKPIEIELPFTVGMWETTQPIQVELKKGDNTLTFTRQGVKQEVEPKGFTIRDFTLTPVTGKVSLAD